MASSRFATTSFCLLLALAGLVPTALARADGTAVVAQSVPHHPLEDHALNEPAPVPARRPRQRDPLLIARGLITESRAAIAMQDFTHGEQLLGQAELELKASPSPELSADICLAYSSLSNSLGKHALSRERERALAASNRQSRALVLLTGALLFVLAVFYILQRRSNQQLGATLARLHESEAQAADLLNLSAGFVFLHDLEGRLLLVNPAAAMALGHSTESLVGRQLQDFQPRGGRSTFTEYLTRVQAEGEGEGVFLIRSGQGDHRHWRYSSRMSAPKDGRAYVVGNAVDVTDQVQHTRALHEQSMRDALTGSYNRRHLERFENEHPGRRTWAAITVDLDHFKKINDQLGHERGDQVLIEFASFLTERVRFGDAVVRQGGDEFLVLLADADQHTLDATSERLAQDAGDAPCAFTLGGALRQPGESLGATIARADAAMYARRTATRGGWAA